MLLPSIHLHRGVTPHQNFDVVPAWLTPTCNRDTVYFSKVTAYTILTSRPVIVTVGPYSLVVYLPLGVTNFKNVEGGRGSGGAEPPLSVPGGVWGAEPPQLTHGRVPSFGRCAS